MESQEAPIRFVGNAKGSFFWVRCQLSKTYYSRYVKLAGFLAV
jgi:hypothetical protein